MTAQEYQLKYPKMTKEEAEKLALIDSQDPKLSTVDWDAQICDSCQ